MLRSFSLSVLSHIRIKCGTLFCKFPYSVQNWENTEQKNFLFKYFSRNVIIAVVRKCCYSVNISSRDTEYSNFIKVNTHWQHIVFLQQQQKQILFLPSFFPQDKFVHRQSWRKLDATNATGRKLRKAMQNLKDNYQYSWRPVAYKFT